MEILKRFEVNGIQIQVHRLIENDYATDHYYNILEIRVNEYRLTKHWYNKGFIVSRGGTYAKSRGHKKKMLSELRKLLGMTKREFSRFMGFLGGFW